MSGKFEETLRSYLRESEQFKIVLEVRVPPEESSDHDSDSIWDAPDKRRVLVVVSHLDPYTGEEQGGVFVFRIKVKRNEEMYIVESVFPISGDFSLAMAQQRRNTIDFQKLPEFSTLNQQRSDFTLTIHPGQHSELPSTVLLARDTVKLRSVLAECKRLKELSTVNNSDAAIPYAWLAPYTSNALPTVLSPIPSDLRNAQNRFAEALSPVSPGQPGDEALDASLIREEWVKHRVQQYTLTKTKYPLRIRLGTFNVNGKMPSQDLSPWVRGRANEKPLIFPPLKETPPVTVEGVVEPSADVVRDRTTPAISSTRDQMAPRHDVVPVSTTATPPTPTLGIGASPKSDLNHDRANLNLNLNQDIDPDLLVLAFQELDLSTEALLYSTKTVREEAWCAAVFAGLGEKAVEYDKLGSKQLVGMLLVLFVKKSIRSCFGDMKTASIGAGILGLMGNKGATAVRLTFTPPSDGSDGTVTSPPRPLVLTFVNAHLAAFDEMYDRRNADFHDISKRLSFDSGIPVQGSPVEEDDPPPVTIPLSIFQTDALFWLGDLNYRINLPDRDVRTLLAEAPDYQGLQDLLKFDQLNLAMRTKKAFSDFVEGPIHHPPSYRFASGLLTDTLGYDTKRKPAWTDRILQMPSPTIHIETLAYTSHPELTMSDHKPVSADCLLHIPIVDSDKLETYVHRLWREISSFEHSEDIPRIQLSTSTIDFGEIYHKRTTTRILDLKNIGKVPCAYRFVPISTEAPINPEWLKIEPLIGLILPGETDRVSLAVALDDKITSRLNASTTAPRFDDTLILHTLLGKDHFISITAQYKRTCFATSIERLVRFPGSVRSSEKRESLELLPEEQALNAPKEVMRLVNWLMSNATDIPGLFLSPGDQDVVADIRECLDTGAEFAPHTNDGTNEPRTRTRVAFAFATCLLELLDSLPEPVIPMSMHARCAQVADREEAFELLDELPSAAVNVWISVTAFLHFISQQPHHAQQSTSGSTGPSYEPGGRLARIFASVLLRDDLSTNTPVSPVAKVRFMRFFVG